MFIKRLTCCVYQINILLQKMFIDLFIEIHNVFNKLFLILRIVGLL